MKSYKKLYESTVYEASDGRIFHSIEECERYEKIESDGKIYCSTIRKPFNFDLEGILPNNYSLSDHVFYIESEEHLSAFTRYYNEVISPIYQLKSSGCQQIPNWFVLTFIENDTYSFCDIYLYSISDLVKIIEKRENGIAKIKNELINFHGELLDG